MFLGDDGFESVRRARDVSCETREVRMAACAFPKADAGCGLSLKFEIMLEIADSP